MDARIAKIKAAAEYLNKAIAPLLLKGRKPQIGIVLGSGLGKLADQIEDPLVIPYSQIPGFPVSTAIGHKGNFIVGNLGGKCVIAMQGRIHYYEGYGMDLVVLPIRVMMTVGIRTLIVSNAAGGVNFAFHVGDLVIIKDHINLLPNPLIGPNLDE
ncbi:MAG: purine-nucleoside phosphorylase, partial [Bacteroidales bacterium]|nr:purine-nucleoside phosphorylase [Bacteroidales bacterium]